MNPLEIPPEQFRLLSERIAEIAADYLRALESRAIPPTESGAELERFYAASLPEQGMAEDALLGLQDVVRHSRAQNGRFFGYVLGSGEAASAASDLLCSVLNQNVTAWRSSPAAVTLERTVVNWLARAVGCHDFSGTLCGGGSAANLMGLAMAREAKAPANQKGVRSGLPTAVYASSEAHMSISKAIALLGIGIDNLRLIPVDRSFRMIPEELDRAIGHDKEHGVIPIAVVASAGTVSTGAIDRLEEIAGIAARYAAWFHIDGAYGALGALAAPEKFRGMDRADSISLDPHKWLYQPIDCGCILFRDAAAARRAFALSGEYVRALGSDPIETYTFFDESVELSRRFRALKLWFSLRYHGFAAFRGSIEKDLRHARRLGDSIERSPELRLLAPIELSAVCFRFVGAGRYVESELDRLNREILKRVVERGKVYLSNASLHSRFCLRACIVNHRTTDADIDCVAAEVLAAAREAERDA